MMSCGGRAAHVKLLMRRTVTRTQEGCQMNVRLVAAIAVITLIGCSPAASQSGPGSPTTTSAASSAGEASSCQPLGHSPSPIAFTFVPGPVSAAVAENISAALYRACQDPNKTIKDLTSTSHEGSGSPSGPNAGQPVWLVQVDAQVVESSGASYGSHFLIEVNQATGAPTVISNG